MSIVLFVLIFIVIGYWSSLDKKPPQSDPTERVPHEPYTPPPLPVPNNLPTPIPSKLSTPAINTISETGSDGIRGAWNSVSNASGYELQWATSQTFTNAVTSFVSTTATWGDLHSLSPNTTYYARVMATGTGRYSNSDYSAVRSATTANIRLDSPAITVTATGSNVIRVTWNPVNNASSYTIQYATNSAFTSDVRSVNSTTTSGNITGLNPNTTYHVRVMAIGAAVESNYSTVRTARTPMLKLGTPAIVDGRWDRNRIGIAWSPIRDASSYRIEYTTDPNFNTGIRTVITGLSALTIYYVRVRATATGFTNSDYSEPIWIRTDR
jgi:hypothetical protein